MHERSKSTGEPPEPVVRRPVLPRSSRSQRGDGAVLAKRKRMPLARSPRDLAIRAAVAKIGHRRQQPGASEGDAHAHLQALADRIRVCVECPLHASRTMAVPGDGSVSAKVMIIGEAPGKKEDETGHPFVGSAGKYLDHVLDGTGFDRADCFITNTVKCRPPSNRNPKALEVDTCTSLYLSEQIHLINPRLVLLLGSVAVKTLLGVPSVEAARGKVIEHEGRKYIASYHPAVRFYREDLAVKVKEDFALLKRELAAIS